MGRIEWTRQVPKAVHVPLLVAGALVLVLALTGQIAEPSTGWFHASYRAFAGTLALNPAGEAAEEEQSPTAAESRRPRCAECGFIESARLANGPSPAMYEITVRLADRSKRVFNDPNPAKWRPGERVILIGGGAPPSR